VTCATEHRAVLDSYRRLEQEGFRVTILPVARDGQLSLNDLESALEAGTILVTLMFANNEIGTIHPIRKIGQLCKEKGIFFHCDAVQAMAYEPLDVQEMGIDLLSISAHKMYGPKGVGALYVRRRSPQVRLEPQLDGGGHERGLRSGTLNVPGIVGLGQAAEIVMRERERDSARIRELRDRFLATITQRLGCVTVNGTLESRLPNNLNLSFPGVEGAAMIAAMKDLAVSSGAACSSATEGPSHVLEALQMDESLILSSIRFGLHRFTTQEEMDYAAEQVVTTAQRLRGLSGLTPQPPPELRRPSMHGSGR
jgi:cysteine desulfurase